MSEPGVLYWEQIKKAMQLIRPPDHVHEYISTCPIAPGFKQCRCGDAIIELSESERRMLFHEYSMITYDKEAPMEKVFGVDVYVTDKVPDGTAIVVDKREFEKEK